MAHRNCPTAKVTFKTFVSNILLSKKSNRMNFPDDGALILDRPKKWSKNSDQRSRMLKLCVLEHILTYVRPQKHKIRLPAHNRM
jgi:hypothetical protein